MATRAEIREAVEKAAYEVPTTDYWRGVMRRSRKEFRHDDGRRGITQGDLAKLVGTSQPTISDIESGAQQQSRFVWPICVALGIPLPFLLIEDEWDERWMEVGRALRHRDMRFFEAQLRAMEIAAGDPDDA